MCQQRVARVLEVELERDKDRDRDRERSWEERE